MKNILFKVVEIILFPLTIFTAIWMKILTKAGIKRTVAAERIFQFFGVLPINDHYYQPLINPKKHLKKSLRENRNLNGIDFNANGQLNLLKHFNYNKELLMFPLEKEESDTVKFFYNNDSFESGDAEFLYNIIRFSKPSKIVEIGSGSSTLIAIEALKKNKNENPDYKFEHICIEPYEQPWLETTPAKIVRKKVEDMDIELFKSLKNNDILFIDSSHIIRPQGDVLFEFLEILPLLNPGVLVHVHDIFSPKDYLNEWIYNEHLLWNEQYLLEAFLSCNKNIEIIGALNFLFHNHREALTSTCPVLKKQSSEREPGSFWFKIK